MTRGHAINQTAPPMPLPLPCRQTRRGGDASIGTDRLSPTSILLVPGSPLSTFCLLLSLFWKEGLDKNQRMLYNLNKGQLIDNKCKLIRENSQERKE